MNVVGDAVDGAETIQYNIGLLKLDFPYGLSTCHWLKQMAFDYRHSRSFSFEGCSVRGIWKEGIQHRGAQFFFQAVFNVKSLVVGCYCKLIFC